MNGSWNDVIDNFLESSRTSKTKTTKDADDSDDSTYDERDANGYGSSSDDDE